MTDDLMKTKATASEAVDLTEREPVTRVLLLGGVGALPDGAPRVDAALSEAIGAHDLRIFALHADNPAAAAWLGQNGADVVSLAGMRGERLDETAAALGGACGIGAGRTEALANAPFVTCSGDVRVGVLAYGEQPAGGFNRRADILGLMAYDQVRMLLSQCDHVIVLLRAGLTGAKLPLPEWRDRYRRLIDAGASVVVDTGAAKGWETYKNGLVFYGLGAPEAGDSLFLSLTLGQNGAMRYETRALECASGELRFSANDAFKTEINEQNKLYLDGAAYLSAADELCLRYYGEQEQPQRKGVFQAILPGKSEAARREEEEKRYALLGDESRRLMTLRALRQKLGD